MRRALLPLHLRNITIVGFEDETPEQKLAREAKEAADKKKDDDDDDDDDGDEGKEGKSENTDGLKSALQKERAERKKLEKEQKALQKRLEEIDNKDKSDTDKAKEDAAKSKATTEKLAAQLKMVAVNNVIIKLAGTQKFRDMDDALQLIDRELIEVDQDEDDPSQVTVDEASIKTALEKLAKKKPHLILADGQEDKSGSKFNGKKQSTKEADEEMLKRQYPALNRSGHTS